MKTKAMYMHTLDGKPAHFVKFHKMTEVVIARREVRHLAASVGTIRNQQRQSREYRKRMGYEDTCVYGYIRIRFPASFPHTGKREP